VTVADERIVVADDGGVRTITWNRPEALNAMSIELWDGTRDALRSAGDDDVRCIVFTGTGRGFTVGQDLAEMADPRQGEAGRGFRGLMDALVAVEVPMIAAVNGMAVGFGATLLPWCDIAIAGESARFKVPFVSLGVTNEAGSSATLPAVMGPQAAARFVLTGDWLSAAEARSCGLVSEVVPDGELLAAAHALAARLAAQPPNALRTTTSLLRAGRTPAWLEAIEREYVAFARLAGGPENLAAIEAFFNR
jgi:enoyl-CoA hydratase/carnithine racemase